MKPVAIVLNGASSSGKTSIARAMQDIWPAPLVHASLDSFTDMFRWTAIQDEATRRECHCFGVRSFHACLPLLASGGYSIVIDHVFEQHAWYEATRDALQNLPACFVAVRCDLATLEERERSRGDRREGLSRWQHQRVHEGKHYDVEVNTSRHGPEACARQILDAVDRLAANRDRS